MTTKTGAIENCLALWKQPFRSCGLGYNGREPSEGKNLVWKGHWLVFSSKDVCDAKLLDAQEKILCQNCPVRYAHVGLGEGG